MDYNSKTKDVIEEVHRMTEKKGEDNWQTKIVEEAKRQLGTNSYRSAVTKDGALACAAFVSGVLRKVGAMKGRGSLSQRNLENILKNQGWKRVWLEDCQPGDVIFWNAYPGRFHGHVGIIAEKGDNTNTTLTIDNSSNRKVPVLRKLNTSRPIRIVLRKE